MIRKQLYLPDNLEREIKYLARKEIKTEAEIIRELLSIGLVRKKPKTAPAEVLLRIAAKAKTGPKDLSANIEAYLYGKKSPNYGQKTLHRR